MKFTLNNFFFGLAVFVADVYGAIKRFKDRKGGKIE